MREPATGILNLFPEFEDLGTVDVKCPIRVKTGPDCDGPKLMLQEHLYNSLWLGWGVFAEDLISMSVWGIPVTLLPKNIVPDASMELSIAMIKVTMRTIAIVILLLEYAVSIGKFTYQHIGFGEGFGMCFGGGTIAREK